MRRSSKSRDIGQRVESRDVADGSPGPLLRSKSMGGLYIPTIDSKLAVTADYYHQPAQPNRDHTHNFGAIIMSQSNNNNVGRYSRRPTSPAENESHYHYHQPHPHPGNHSQFQPTSTSTSIPNPVNGSRMEMGMGHNGRIVPKSSSAYYYYDANDEENDLRQPTSRSGPHQIATPVDLQSVHKSVISANNNSHIREHINNHQNVYMTTTNGEGRVVQDRQHRQRQQSQVTNCESQQYTAHGNSSTPSSYYNYRYFNDEIITSPSPSTKSAAATTTTNAQLINGNNQIGQQLRGDENSRLVPVNCNTQNPTQPRNNLMNNINHYQQPYRPANHHLIQDLDQQFASDKIITINGGMTTSQQQQQEQQQRSRSQSQFHLNQPTNHTPNQRGRDQDRDRHRLSVDCDSLLFGRSVSYVSEFSPKSIVQNPAEELRHLSDIQRRELDDRRERQEYRERQEHEERQERQPPAVSSTRKSSELRQIKSPPPPVIPLPPGDRVRAKPSQPPITVVEMMPTDGQPGFNKNFNSFTSSSSDPTKNTNNNNSGSVTTSPPSTFSSASGSGSGPGSGHGSVHGSGRPKLSLHLPLTNVCHMHIPSTVSQSGSRTGLVSINGQALIQTAPSVSACQFDKSSADGGLPVMGTNTPHPISPYENVPTNVRRRVVDGRSVSTAAAALLARSGPGPVPGSGSRGDAASVSSASSGGSHSHGHHPHNHQPVSSQKTKGGLMMPDGANFGISPTSPYSPMSASDCLDLSATSQSVSLSPMSPMSLMSPDSNTGGIRSAPVISQGNNHTGSGLNTFLRKFGPGGSSTRDGNPVTSPTGVSGGAGPPSSVPTSATSPLTSGMPMMMSMEPMMMGAFMMRMHGLQGFARLCPGDVYEISVRHGEGQQWKSRGRILKGDQQVWDNPEHRFRVILGEPLRVKAVEVKGLVKKNKVIGEKSCTIQELFETDPQLMTIKLNQSGSIKLHLIVTWNPLYVSNGKAGSLTSLSRSLAGSTRALPTSSSMMAGLSSLGSPVDQQHQNNNHRHSTPLSAHLLPNGSAMMPSPRNAPAADDGLPTALADDGTPILDSGDWDRTIIGRHGQSRDRQGYNTNESGGSQNSSSSGVESAATSASVSLPISSPTDGPSSGVGTRHGSLQGQKVLVEVHRNGSTTTNTMPSDTGNLKCVNNETGRTSVNHQHRSTTDGINNGRLCDNVISEMDEIREEVKDGSQLLLSEEPILPDPSVGTTDYNHKRNGHQHPIGVDEHVYIHSLPTAGLETMVSGVLNAMEDIQGSFQELQPLMDVIQGLHRILRFRKLTTSGGGHSSGRSKLPTIVRSGAAADGPARSELNGHSQSGQLRRCSTESSINSISVESALECFDFLNSTPTDYPASDIGHQSASQIGSRVSVNSTPERRAQILAGRRSGNNKIGDSMADIISTSSFSSMQCPNTTATNLSQASSLNLLSQASNLTTTQPTMTTMTTGTPSKSYQHETFDSGMSSMTERAVKGQLSTTGTVIYGSGHESGECNPTSRLTSAGDHFRRLTTGNEELDLALVAHLSYCHKLIDNLGHYGPLRARERRSLEKLTSQIPTMTVLVKLAGSILSVVGGNDTDDDTDDPDRDHDIGCRPVRHEIAFRYQLISDTRVASLWSLAVGTADRLCVTSSRFAQAIANYLSGSSPVTGQSFSIAQGHGRFDLNRAMAAKVAKHFTCHIADVTSFEPDSIVTLLQCQAYFENFCSAVGSGGGGNGPMSLSLDHVLMSHVEQISLLDGLHSDDPLRIKQVLDKFRKTLPSREILETSAILLLNEDQLVVRMAEMYFAELTRHKSMRDALLTRLRASLESGSVQVRRGACLVLSQLRAVELMDELCHVTFNDENATVRNDARLALLSFGQEGMRVIQEAQLYSNGFTGLRNHVPHDDHDDDDEQDLNVT